MSRRTTHAMAMALRGQPVAEVEAIAVRTWASVRKDVFAFARPLIAELREAGYEPAIVSGSPHEIVRCIGDDLGVRLVHGATFGQTVGRFDGRVLLATGTAGGKRRVVDTIALACGADLRASLALGTSMLEADLLRAAGDAIVFGREPFLTRAARYEGWRVATEADVLHVVRLALGGRASVRPARGNAYDRHVISSAFE